jgi:hypothetical protein
MTFELAQLNIATMKAPLDSPVMADFVANLERINTLAEQSPGFVWRLKDESGDATAIRPFGDDIVVNMSVWKDIASVHHYVFRTAHTEMLKRKREWFERMNKAYTVLWWVPSGHKPTLAEAAEHLEHLRAQGSTARAFTFKDAFPPPDAICPGSSVAFGEECPA